MSDRKFLRIAALYERDDCVKIDGQWHVPLAGLGDVLAEHGMEIVPRRAPYDYSNPTPTRSTSDLQERSSSRWRPARNKCGCATLDDCLRRGCGTEKTCGCATLDDCLRRGC